MAGKHRVHMPSLIGMEKCEKVRDKEEQGESIERIESWKNNDKTTKRQNDDDDDDDDSHASATHTHTYIKNVFFDCAN